ncbi:MAG: rhomboid family intramembrane serine protease [Halobacteriaceae archaeon]
MSPSRRAFLRDVGFVGTLALVLVTVHRWIPGGLAQRLAFEYGSPASFEAWTAVLVHADWEHLLANLMGLLLAGLLGALLASRFDHHRRFRHGMAGVLLLAPPAGMATSWLVFETVYTIPPNTVTRGASGVVAGLTGYLGVTTLAVLTRRAGRVPAVGTGLVVWLGTMAGMVLREPVTSRDWTLPLAGVGILLAGSLVLREDGRYLGWPTIRRRLRANRLDAALLGEAILSTIVLGVALFPIDWAAPGDVTDIFGHAGGLLAGCLVATVLVVRDRRA